MRISERQRVSLHKNWLVYVRANRLTPYIGYVSKLKLIPRSRRLNKQVLLKNCSLRLTAIIALTKIN